MVRFRNAQQEDLTCLVHLLADDPLGRDREDTTQPLDERYQQAFQTILSNAQNQMIVAELDYEIVGMCQLTFIPYLTHKGGWRCLIEGVRVKATVRGQGVGTALIHYALDLAKASNCIMVQLTSDKSRPDAIAFYQRLGFRDSHEGLKLLIG
ncbi:GNAT family acetyltransferase [Vibrio cidicii]|uniref:GNAT family acetyltransferase n=1 Tax=Vibrio cidicii TaxID=1763883 RepID=A0ABR5VXS4_9VIBR|nr:GNAT family N-acetyltransferase [Vibrio cidicii]KYN82486.1 GNAT family acetyltransferase [Vibrio cidicii]